MAQFQFDRRTLERAKKWLGTVAPFMVKQDAFVMTSKGLSPGIEVGDDSMAIYRPGGSKTVPASKAMDANHGWVYAGVKAIADEIANTEFRLFAVDAETGDQIEQPEHELLDLLDAVNDFQTGPELKHLIASHLELTGNAYLLLAGVKNDKDKPTAIYTLNPGSVKVALDKTTYPYKVTGYQFTLEGRKYIYKPYEIVHLKYPDPSDPYVGLGAVQAIAPWIDLDSYGTESNRQFFIRGAQLGKVLKSEMISEAEINAMRISFDENHSGTDNAHRTTVLPKGVDFANPTVNGKDMDYAKLLDATRDRILGGLRVGKTLLGSAESDTNRATAETADYVFAKRVIKPKMQLICSYLNERLVPRYGEGIYLSFIDPTPEDKNFRTLEMQAATASQPVLSVNEARENYMGLGPVTGGDTVKVASTMTDVGGPEPVNDTPEKGMLRKTAGLPGAKKAAARITATRFTRTAKLRSTMSEDLADKITKRLLEMKLKGIHELSHDEYHAVWASFVSRVEAHQPALRDTVVKLNNDQSEEVLANLPALYEKHKDVITDAELFAEEKWVSATIDALTPELRAIAEEESKNASAAVGKPGVNILEDEAAAKALDERIALMAKTYNSTTLSALKDTLAKGLAAGEGLDHLTERVKSVYEYSDQYRAERLARTESFAIANYSTKEAWKQTGVVTTIKWYTAEDDHVCEFCDALDGTVIGIEDNFASVGSSITGAKGGSYNVDYADVGVPPLHPDCRCYAQPEDVSIE